METEAETVEAARAAQPAEPELAAEAETVEAAQAIGSVEDLTRIEDQDPLAEAPSDTADLAQAAAATDRSAAEAAGPATARVSDGDSPAAVAMIDEDELRGALEAIMLVVDEPVQEIVLAQVLEQPTERVAAALEAISAGYTRDGHGFELRRAAGGWRLYTRPQYAGYVERFVLDGQSVRLTQAALETLAVIAYKQPVTRGRISAIRGVNCDGVVRTLTSRGLIEEAGTEPETGAYLYRTTALFLEKLGLDSVDQLPDLAPFLPDDVDEVADGER
ncbi:SMC-Scp complex subunit ScpB [Asanoa sp. WMMD1127]|uniref:SMC-Scp complex subunit ScpB n=1 Tax=Asanoa sp. WMMD1127 TaxID=3016107 RepID=UPI0024160A83|nr:SMC-Scp complex subunit ScpB [Asanoa sp. WMMD1127]MDG4824556.1 SMC-Scp complex subunit ScpB [Asanoa sp. WMMD1127]